MLISQPPSFIKKVYPSLRWKQKTSEKELFITFDDGPTPKVTEKVLDLLLTFGAKATFFCLGKNIEKNPELYQRILAEGHTVGNHTFNHKNGWKHTTAEFVHDTLSFDEVHSTELFRPPYGRIKSAQIKALKKRYKIIMWSILTQDYNGNLSPQECSSIACSNWKKGSILVFHDSVKAEKNMLYALKEVLQKAKAEDWKCSAISR